MDRQQQSQRSSTNMSIPRQRYLHPDDWDINMACIHPTYRPEYQYVCIDAELYIDKRTDTTVGQKNRAKLIKHYSDCPVCFGDATMTCAQCGTVSYCSKACQTKHWKSCHKKACQKNPNLHKFKLKLKIFDGLTEDCFRGHEFLVVKPGESLSNLQQICDETLVDADDLFDIPGFGENQMNPQWLIMNGSKDPTCRKMIQKFGWKSGHMGMEPVYGYRCAEARHMFFCWCDDSFQARTDLDINHYGRALFPPLESGKHVRGNIVVFKLYLKNKKLKPASAHCPTCFVSGALSRRRRQQILKNLYMYKTVHCYDHARLKIQIIMCTPHSSNSAGISRVLRISSMSL